MFEFLRKRLTKPAAMVARLDPPVPATIAEIIVPDRAIALARVAELAGDEVAAVDFLLRCEFADARLLAAEQVHSRVMVERVLRAMRNSDRRVAKLMQARLDICKQWESDERQAAACIAQAQQLLAVAQLTPNQVAALDRAWQPIRHVARPLQHTFEALRSSLQQRLFAQAELQRALLDGQAQVRHWLADGAFALSADAGLRLDALAQQVAEYSRSAEAASLPKNLLPEFAQAMAELRQSLQRAAQAQEAIAARQSLLDQWEAAEPGSLAAEDLMRAWRAIPALPDHDLAAPLQARLDALLMRIGQASVVRKEPGQPSSRDLQAQFTDALGRLDQALQDGGLQAAAEQDRTLRALDVQRVSPSTAQLAMLARLRTELVRLQGWAKWGGHVSREELLHAAASLPAQSLPAAELARKVGSLRERWKSLDASAGPAGKDLWQRFDQACTAAYAPAAVHFSQLAEERLHNAAKAKALLDECRTSAQTLLAGAADADLVDWKAVSGLLERMRQTWRQLGVIDRKEKKPLDAEFASILRSLSAPLAERHRDATAQREALIAQAASLDPHARGTPDDVRRLQDCWQLQARAMPLERRQEQALWQRFRSQCDQVFAQRKEVAQAADIDRRQHLAEKAALCVQLEAALSAPEAEIRRLLREIRHAWNQLGAVPRAAERDIENRYRQAEQALQQRLQDAKQQELAAELQALQARVQLCLALEQQLAPAATLAADQLVAMQDAWAGLPAADPEYTRLLQARFAAGIAAAAAQDRDYALQLESNSALLLQELLRLEIVTGMDSPAEFSRERLQLQVEVLQSSLKSGQRQQAARESRLLAALCRLPAQADAQTLQRIERLLEHCRSASVSA